MKAEFISRVMQIMNELGWDDTESNAFVGSDTTKVKGHIESVFVDAWRKAVNILPRNFFEIRDFSTNDIVGDIHSGMGIIYLPDDFYLLCSFKMKGWRKAAETLYDSSDTIASIQSNEYTRGNPVRPVCVKNITYTAGRSGETYSPMPVLNYYSLPKGSPHEVETALYIPLIRPLSDEPIISEKLFTPLAYLCASMVFDIYEKVDIARVLEAKATDLII